jgi:DNA (cytosine-5)-methyltransferase 1
LNSSGLPKSWGLTTWGSAMRYLSVCSGIEAATVAWHPLGWEPVAFAEVERFPSAVLAHHYPAVPNLGDMNEHATWKIQAIDVLVGGTPCQSFSVAGLRQGLADPRGGLMLRFLEIAQRHRPQWVVWENVPGVLSSNGGRDFGTLLGGLEELGYGWAYRILDAQFFGVAQRRRRVFVVACAGDQRRAGSVLFESESMCGHPAKSAAKGKDATPAIAGCLGSRMRRDELDGHGAYVMDAVAFQQNSRSEVRLIGGDGNLVGAITAEPGAQQQNYIAFPSTLSGTQAQETMRPNISPALTRLNPMAVADLNAVHVGTLEANDGQKWGCGQWVRQRKYVITSSGQANAEVREDGIAPSLTCLHEAPIVAGPMGDGRLSGPLSDKRELCKTICAAVRTGERSCSPASATTTATAQGAESTSQSADVLDQPRTMSSSTVKMPTESSGRVAVRRLTPRECERLQGFPDDYTLIPYRGKAAEDCPDGPRYKALGNSMAVPCMRWIGERIAAASCGID